jgi:two-component system, LytTR family, sensor kinase
VTNTRQQLDAPERRIELPSVTATTSPLEWLVVCLAWLVLSLSSVGTLTARSRESGVAVALGDLLILQLVDLVAWLALIWPLFRAYDRWPLRAGARSRALAARTAATLVTVALHVVITWPSVALLVRSGWLSGSVTALHLGTPAGMFVDDLLNISVAVILYAVLSRLHRRRLELLRSTALQESLREAKLHALDLELRPHFLFNTLNGVVALIASEPARAERMVVTLCDLLRVTMARTGTEVTVRDELRQLQLYLDIQRIRFGEQLSIVVSADSSTLDMTMPAMLLQPLVENSLTHGLARKCDVGQITIRIRPDVDFLELSVSDDGVGLPATGWQEGIGLRNSRDRLTTLYGDRATIALVNNAGSNAFPGARTVVRIPPRRGTPQ